jgi:hypothetical protein
MATTEPINTPITATKDKIVALLPDDTTTLLHHKGLL